MPKNNESPSIEAPCWWKWMSEKERYLQKINEEFVKFARMMEELHFLRYVAKDLKNFREMIKLRKYDSLFR